MIEVRIGWSPLKPGCWQYNLARELREAGAPVHSKFKGFVVIGRRAYGEWELVLERGVLEHFKEPGGDRFVWREK